MNDLANHPAYGVLTEPATLTIKRLLPGPIERIWTYLTDGEKRRLWLASGDMEPKADTPFEFVWRNDELSTKPTKRPDSFSEESRMKSRITAFDPPFSLSFTWEDGGDVTFDLEEQGTEVLLTVTHRRLPDRATMLGVSAGWHTHLDILEAVAGGREPEPFWENWARLRQDYEARLPA